MTRWRWVRKDLVYAAHDWQLAEHGGLSGVLDPGRLEAALVSPQNLAAYSSPDAAALAASYAYSLLRNHPFADGNKRTAWVVARVFLLDNGYDLEFEPAEAVRTVESAAADTLKEPQLASWFRQRMRRRSPSTRK